MKKTTVLTALLFSVMFCKAQLSDSLLLNKLKFIKTDSTMLNTGGMSGWVLKYSTTPKYDTLAAHLLIGDIEANRLGMTEGFIVVKHTTFNDYPTIVEYLDKKRKPFPFNIIIWQSKNK